MPFYAVRVGKKPGIYNSWDCCKAVVTGFPNAKFKRFDTKEQAEIFLQEESNSDSLPSKEHHQSQPLPACRRHNFISRENFPSSPVVYAGSCYIENGSGNVMAGIGVYWAPSHPYNLRESVGVVKPTSQRIQLMAAMKALQIASLMEISSVELRTCSEHTINSVAEFLQEWQDRGWKSSGTNISEEMLSIADYCKNISITWAYVSPDERCFGIEEAERLAKEGAADGL